MKALKSVAGCFAVAVAVAGITLAPQAFDNTDPAKPDAKPVTVELAAEPLNLAPTVTLSPAPVTAPPVVAVEESPGTIENVTESPAQASCAMGETASTDGNDNPICLPECETMSQVGCAVTGDAPCVPTEWDGNEHPVWSNDGTGYGVCLPICETVEQADCQIPPEWLTPEADPRPIEFDTELTEPEPVEQPVIVEEPQEETPVVESPVIVEESFPETVEETP